MKTNITIRIDAELAREAKVLAAQQGLSLSKMVAGELGRMVSKETAYKVAKSKAQLAIKEAPALNYNPVSRDSLHER